MEKRIIDRRIEQMEARRHRIPHQCRRWRESRHRRAASHQRCRDLGVWCNRVARPADPRSGTQRHLSSHGVLAAGQPRCSRATSPRPPINANGKHVIIIGGGDTGADCLGTSHRQGAPSVTQLGDHAAAARCSRRDNPWPQWSLIMRTSSAHEEGGERVYSVNTERFLDDGNGNVRALLLHEVEMVGGRFQRSQARIASCQPTSCSSRMGFLGPEKGSWLDQLGVALTSAAMCRATTTSCPAFRACSWPETWVVDKA